jgi:molybdopterin molybdotransferase
MINKQASCDDFEQAELISVKQALASILSTVKPIKQTQQLALEQTVGRCLMEDIQAHINVPAQNNSAVDGYAVYDADAVHSTARQLLIAGQSFAGKPYQGKIVLGQCLRIMTGATLPTGMTTVIMQEQVAVDGDFIYLDQSYKIGQNVRLAGEDLAQGEIVLPAGRYLTPPDIGLLASLGLIEIKVKRKLRVAIASSGDELVELGDLPRCNGIYDSNRYSLLAALTRADIEVIDLGIIADNPDCLLATFQTIAHTVDLIIATGGVSVGDADHTKLALRTLGQVDFWKIAIKPGRPVAFGQIGGAAFFGLPGNPVAVMVTFYQLVLPAIAKMIEITDAPLVPIFKAQALANISKKIGRTEVQRGILKQDADGLWGVNTTGKQGSGILHSMSLANVFIILEPEIGNVSLGEMVNVQPFSGLF